MARLLAVRLREISSFFLLSHFFWGLRGQNITSFSASKLNWIRFHPIFFSGLGGGGGKNENSQHCSSVPLQSEELTLGYLWWIVLFPPSCLISLAYENPTREVSGRSSGQFNQSSFTFSWKSVCIRAAGAHIIFILTHFPASVVVFHFYKSRPCYTLLLWADKKIFNNLAKRQVWLWARSYYCMNIVLHKPLT